MKSLKNPLSSLATINSRILPRFFATLNSLDSSRYDATQVSLLEEPCILVDESDRPIGRATKKDCHLLANIQQGMLHRAFSVFLFDQQNKRLLLQQRALTKITYPNHWTNACCSHPLDVPAEREGPAGVRNAALRRLAYELGIDTTRLSADSLHYVTRIQYRADNVPSDGIFGEHEIDHVLLLIGNFELRPNENEVRETRYVEPDELREMIAAERNGSSGHELLTPWFKLIADKYLFKWWASLDDIDSIKNHVTIDKFS